MDGWVLLSVLYVWLDCGMLKVQGQKMKNTNEEAIFMDYQK